jgi:hypothetical protein
MNAIDTSNKLVWKKVCQYKKNKIFSAYSNFPYSRYFVWAAGMGYAQANSKEEAIAEMKKRIDTK